MDPTPPTPNDSPGLLFHPLFWAGMIIAIISVICGTWSPLCFFAGIGVGGATAECIVAARK